MEKVTTKGSQTIERLFDAGTFVETGAFIKRKDGELTGVVCGYGSIGGKLAYAFSQDSDRAKGAFDAVQANKIAALYQMAMKNGAPVIGVFDSVGAMVCDGSSAMAAYGTVLAAVSAASGVIPQIAVIKGVCAGMAATVAAMFDFAVTIKDTSEWYVGAPFLLGKEIGTAAYTEENGLSSISVATEEEALATAAKLVSILPSNNEEGIVADEASDDVNRALASGLTGEALLTAIADGAATVMVGASYAAQMQTGFAVIGGVTCGIVSACGAITGEGAKKAAKLIGFCDSFSIPVVTLVDSIGVALDAKEEKAPLAAQLGKLAMAYATATTPKITVVVGKAYGAAFTLLGSKALGADMVYALPTAEISVMAPASAVAFLWNDRITAEVSRASLEETWVKENASPEVVAADGSIDDVIDSAELRQRICAAVYMLQMKNSGEPSRKHCNLPL